MTDSMADLTLEQRNAALIAWLNDLTTVYEKCAAERDELRRALSALYTACVAADLQEDLSSIIDGALLDDAHSVLTHLAEARP